MKIVTFQSDGQPARVGALVEELVIDLNVASAQIPADLAALIESGQPGLELVRTVVADVHGVRDDAVHQLADVKLTAPWPGRRISMAGANYAQHVLDGLNGFSRKRTAAGDRHGPDGEDLPAWTTYSAAAMPRTLEETTEAIRAQGPWGFWKTLAWVTNPGDDLQYPRRTRHLDYEGEVAIVFAKTAKNIRACDIDEYVWGVTLFNDWSDRDAFANPRPLSHNLAKNFDGALTIGPCIVVDELDPQDIDVATHVNGEARQQYNTKEMVFSFGECAEELTRDLTLVAGDMLAGGTNAGTAIDIVGPVNMDDPALDRWFLHPGDVVEVSSPQIGTFSNAITEGNPASS
jgi:2-keto-4-pentenoate hydratase/2-oxohepta-3-ene-1,7-dioic acid hydratase in catechol pathway